MKNIVLTIIIVLTVSFSTIAQQNGMESFFNNNDMYNRYSGNSPILPTHGYGYNANASGNSSFYGNLINNQTFGSSNEGGINNQVFGASNLGSLNNQTFGATNNGNISNQVFGNYAPQMPLDGGLLIMICACIGYATLKNRKKEKQNI